MAPFSLLPPTLSRRALSQRLTVASTAAALCLLIALFGLAPSALAQDGGAVVAADDAVVGEVVRMLDGGVSVTIISAWLETGERRFGPLSPNDLLALTGAPAPEELIRWLLENAQEASAPPPAPTPEPAPAPATPAPEPAPEPAPTTPIPGTPAPVTPTPTAPNPASQPAASSAAADGLVPVEFRVRYSPLPDEDEDPPYLFVYLAGQVLTSADPSGLLTPRGLEFRHRVPPGRHEVRILAEIHEKDGDEWIHEARVLERLLILDVLPGEPWIAELEITEPRFSLDGGAKLEWRVFRGTEVRAEEDTNVPLLSSWPYLCEDVQITYANDKGKVARSQRWKLDDCVRWPTLWTGTPDAAGRDEVLAVMERYGYRPVPADTR
ncbi:MAG: hypothetical protein AAGD01_14620 [Acidobacteriota bacterium]